MMIIVDDHHWMIRLASESKPSGADPAPNYGATPNYGAEGCPAVRFIVYDPHQVL